MLSARTEILAENLQALYRTRHDLPFHGWPHISFVTREAVSFGAEFPDADLELLEAAALTHDLNYLVRQNSGPEVGSQLRMQHLIAAHFEAPDCATIDDIVIQASTGNRTADIPPEAKALSDGDTLFKALPTTPVLLSGLFAIENGVSLKKLAHKVVKEQRPLMEHGIYFYTVAAKRRALGWAAVNLQLWENMLQFYEDQEPTMVELRDQIARLLAEGQDLGYAPQL